jgi:hypothetical protein
MLQDVVALSDHATYLSNKTNFLLDATLGLINLEQNQIIKIFSIAARMSDAADADRFVLRNELQAHAGTGMAFGYPYALALMLITAIIPFVWFKRQASTVRDRSAATVRDAFAMRRCFGAGPSSRHSECGYSGMPALRKPSLIRSCCCRYFGLVSAKGTGERRRNVDILVSGYLCR